KEAIRKLWQDLLASPGFELSWKPTRVEASKSGDMAHVSGTYEFSINDASGKPFNDRGKYLEVWKKQADGNWKCAADMWNSDFAAIFLRGVHSFNDLDAVSKLRFSAFENRFFKNFEGMYYSRSEGILTSELWGEIERTMSDFLAYDGVRQWWETRKHWHTEAF